MTVLKLQIQIADASPADLVETYNALTGKAIKKFENRQVAERRVEMAMLAAQDADGHTGVPKGAATEVKTRAEIEEKAAVRGVVAPPGPDATEADPVFPPGSLAEGLIKAGARTKAITPRLKKAQTDAPKALAIYAVQATFAGTSKPQAGSVRNNVLVHIQAAKNSASTIEALDKHFQHSTRGYVQKLLEKNHLVILDEAAYDKAQPVARPKSP